MQEENMQEELHPDIWRILGLIEAWRGRWGIYISKIRADYCGQCRRIMYCRRTYANEFIRRALFKGEDCPDLDSVWERIIDGKR